MKKVFIGLAIGLLLSGIAVLAVIPQIKQTSYDSGFNTGNVKGIATGTAAGITEGIAELKATQDHARDSAAAADKREEALHKTSFRQKRVAAPVQNWHVVGDKIADPIVDSINI